MPAPRAGPLPPAEVAALIPATRARLAAVLDRNDPRRVDAEKASQCASEQVVRPASGDELATPPPTRSCA